MPFENVRPTTLSGIKSLAKHLKVSEGVSHAAALDLAARRASYENFRHARNRLQYAPSAPRETHRVYLTSYWNDDRAREQGRETMVVELSVPWSGLGKPADLKRSRYLGGFKFLQPDHLVDAGLRLCDRGGAPLPGLSAIGRLTEDWTIGNDTLDRTAQTAPEVWARRITAQLDAATGTSG